MGETANVFVLIRNMKAKRHSFVRQNVLKNVKRQNSNERI